MPTDIRSTQIRDLSIINADYSSSAPDRLAGSKVSSDFGAQDVNIATGQLYKINNVQIALNNLSGVAITAPASGHTLYYNSGAGQFQNTGSLIWDNTNVRLGIGVAVPLTALHVSGTATATAFAGPLTGAVTGNASTATALQTARTINGTSFDGTSNVTVTAAAGTLTGATLNATVTASSLASLGSLASLTVLGATSLSTTSGNVTAGTASAGVDSRAAGSVTSSASFFLGVLAGDPSTPVAGQLWYNSTDQQFKGRNATSIVILG